MKQHEYQRYAVYLYHGGEAPDQCFGTNSLEHAREIALRAEHAVIDDTLEGRFVE